MSEVEKQKKYQFTSNVRLPNMSEIEEAASDFSAPDTKNLNVSKTLTQSGAEILKSMSNEQQELQKLGMQVADVVEEQKRLRKAKEEARAAELRRLREERDEIAKKQAEEAQAKSDEEKKQSIQEAKDRAAARKEAERAEQERLNLERQQEEEAQAELLEAEAEMQGQTFFEEDPFAPSGVTKREPKAKEEFKETVLKEDYQEEMEFREDSSETVDSDYWDF